jgi:hypothetical protein
MNLTNAKSMLVQTITCELDMLQQGNVDCANRMLAVREAAMVRAYMVECMIADDPVTFKPVIDYLFEQVKEMVYFITQSSC